MSTVFFHKNGRTAILDSRGQRIPFEPLGDARNVIKLEDSGEPDEASKTIADLRLYIERKLGGVSEIDEATYDDLKKNLPHRPDLSYARRSQQHRLLETDNMVPKSRSPEVASARPVAGPAGAAPAAASGPARIVAAQAKPGEPKSGGRPVRTNARTAAKAAVPIEPAPIAVAPAPVAAPASDVPPPPVEASATATPEQSAGVAVTETTATTE
jgi:hypothetical protein